MKPFLKTLFAFAIILFRLVLVAAVGDVFGFFCVKFGFVLLVFVT